MKTNSIKLTRFARIGYLHNNSGNWQFIDIEQTLYNGFMSRIGSVYTTEIELLSDIDRFVNERGYNN